MAQLKDTVVSGSLRATDTIYSTKSQFQILNIPTASGGTTYGPGSSGQVLKSNGTSVYWASDSDANVTQTPTTTSAAYELLFSATADNTTRTEGARKTSTLTYNPSTKALLTGGTIDGLTLAPQTTGFKISGGSTTSKTLTVGADYTLGAACAKGVTDNSAATAISSSDTNLITGRTLYYAGYVKSSGVTSITIQTTSPISGGSATATTSTGSYTIYLADAYGDTKNPYGTKTANYVLAGPTSGSAAAPTFRALVAADIPALSINDKTSDTLSVDRGGTNLTSTVQGGIMYGSSASAFAMTAAGTSGQFLKSNGVNAPTWNNVLTSDIKPMTSKTYSNVTVSADDEANGVLYFGKVTITDTTNYGTPWYVKYRLTVTTSEANTRGVYDCQVGASGSTLIYSNYNNFYSIDYRPILHHRALYPKSGYSSQGAYLGFRVQSSRSPTTLARNYTIEIYECFGCTIAFQNTLATLSSVYNSTYYNSGEMNGGAQGLQESGDANDPWFVRYYNIIAESAINSGNIIVGTSSGYKHLKAGTSFDITYPILYAGSNITASSVGNNNYIFNYSINIQNTQTITLTSNAAVYIKGTISGKNFTPASSAPLTQTLPTSDDGYAYYYIGMAYSSTHISFDATARHIVWYKEGAIRDYGDYLINTISSATIDSIIASNTLNNTTFSTNWGDIDGTISSQEDLSAALSNKINASDLAIVVNGDTSAAEIPVYGYAYIKNNTHGLVEGLYTNTSNDVFPTTGGTANSSVFTGASNTLNNITIRTFDIEVGNTAVSATGSTSILVDYPPDFDPTTDKIISVFLYYSWPLSNWTNGAVVAIKDATDYLTGTGTGNIALTATSAQNYNLGFRIMYT